MIWVDIYVLAGLISGLLILAVLNLYLMTHLFSAILERNEARAALSQELWGRQAASQDWAKKVAVEKAFCEELGRRVVEQARELDELKAAAEARERAVDRLAQRVPEVEEFSQEFSRLLHEIHNDGEVS